MAHHAEDAFAFELDFPADVPDGVAVAARRAGVLMWVEPPGVLRVSSPLRLRTEDLNNELTQWILLAIDVAVALGADMDEFGEPRECEVQVPMGIFSMFWALRDRGDEPLALEDGLLALEDAAGGETPLGGETPPGGGALAGGESPSDAESPSGGETPAGGETPEEGGGLAVVPQQIMTAFAVARLLGTDKLPWRIVPSSAWVHFSLSGTHSYFSLCFSQVELLGPPPAAASSHQEVRPHGRIITVDGHATLMYAPPTSEDSARVAVRKAEEHLARMRTPKRLHHWSAGGVFCEAMAQTNYAWVDLFVTSRLREVLFTLLTLLEADVRARLWGRKTSFHASFRS